VQQTFQSWRPALAGLSALGQTRPDKLDRVGSVRIGIDLGGTKIEGIALDGSAEVARLRVDTPRDGYPATVAAIAALVSHLEQRADARGTVGVGIPGTISATTGLVKNANSVWLIGQPLLHDLQIALCRDVRIANDANCFAASEAADGAGAGASVVFGVIVGTGTGAGIVAHGHVLTGPNRVAGEWGHNPMPWPQNDEAPGPPCYCGKRGCIETFLSGPGLAADYEHQTGCRLTPQEIVHRAERGDSSASEVFARYERRMARALGMVINVLDPDVIVLGGGLSKVERLYETVPQLWNEWIFAAGREEQARTPLVRAVHGDASGVRGAAWLWPVESQSSG
jgi:fructokinase